MYAGTSVTDITPESEVWMDGMIREHKSAGIHDRIYARTLVISPDANTAHSCGIVSVEVCGLSAAYTDAVRAYASEKTGIPEAALIIATTHTHSGPATMGLFNPAEEEYNESLKEKIAGSLEAAVNGLKPAMAGCATGHEDTISHYRRLLADDGHVVMNWEPYPAEKIVKPLGDIDPEVGVLKFVCAENREDTIGILFNHAGHPNVMSGDNYLISGDYSGLAMSLLEEKYGGAALFLNGAQGTMDIDGLRDRDWEGVERTGGALADSVSNAVQGMVLSDNLIFRTGYIEYSLPPRIITEAEMKWAESVLQNTGGAVKAMADGVGDDYKASLYKKLNSRANQRIEISQTCFAMGDCAFISFPGELFTEIGMHIKQESPFKNTFIIGLANGEIGYVPTLRAVGEGGYAVETREVDARAEEIVVSRSLALLEELFKK